MSALKAPNRPPASLSFLGPRQNFLGLDLPFCDLEKAKFAVVPVAFERTTSYMKGTKNGPNKLLEASRQVEFYDEELRREIAQAYGVATVPVLKPKPNAESKEFLLKTSAVVRELAQAGKFVATVGGEHTVTFAPVNAFKDLHKDLSILYIDAHADLRDRYEGTPWNHACALRRSIEACQSVGGKARTSLVAIRNLDIEEARYIQDNSNLALFTAHDHRSLASSIARIVDHLGEHVYISVDLDGLDPSIMPGVGTPQPGGLLWYETLDLLKEVFKKRKVVGVDLMELAPIKGQVVSEFTAAKLLYRIFGYAARGAE